MLLSFTEPATPEIFTKLDGIELVYQCITAELLERNENFCCWYYELTAGILEREHVSPGKNNFIIEAEFFKQMLWDDAETFIDEFARICKEVH